MRFVAYFRVSTAKQGQSGLGLEAQRQTVIDSIGENELIEEFTEVESGKDNSRPQFQAALKRARLTNSTLIVAKLDRLSRNAAFLNDLFDADVPIRCADMPFADRFTVGILAQVAQWERERISDRTKAALVPIALLGVMQGLVGRLSISAALADQWPSMTLCEPRRGGANLLQRRIDCVHKLDPSSAFSTAQVSRLMITGPPNVSLGKFVL